MSDLMDQLDLPLVGRTSVQSFRRVHHSLCLLLELVCSNWHSTRYVDVLDLFLQIIHRVSRSAILTIHILQRFHGIHTCPACSVRLILIVVDPRQL